MCEIGLGWLQKGTKLGSTQCVTLVVELTLKKPADFRSFYNHFKAQSYLAIRNFLVALKLFLNAKCSLMPSVPYSYEVNGKLITGNGSSITICSLSPSYRLYRL